MPCYVMDRVAPLPRQIGSVICSSFYSQKALDQGVEAPLMCRLYFGKKEVRSSPRPSLFINPINFPLDVARYDLLCNECPNELDLKEEVAEGMGEMLARMHWIAGYDARDVEFVMAGSPYTAEMRAFDKNNGNVSELVNAFFSNDPYYPRPVLTDSLYTNFKQMYMRSCPEEYRTRGALFLQTIEARYAKQSATV
ncbi:hypothetical protein H2248_008558 [Termitomyces sp. 'cryptogamus']|nr:hypothetical protein H2248_008558 [Termitomyces sp. 'cryptogamus']